MIYFLLNKGNVVYIGKTRNIKQRLSQHRKNKTFDNYLTMNASQEELREYKLIKRFKPKYNGSRISLKKELAQL